MRRAFWLSSAVIFLDEVVFIAIYPLLPGIAEELGLSKTEVGLLLAAYPLCMLLSSLPAGILVDRFGTQRVLIAGCGLLVAATVAFAYAEGGWQLWAGRGLQGLASGLTSVAGMAAIASGAVSGRRATLIGFATTLQGLSAFAGPALGGFLAPAFGLEIAFLVPAALGLVVCVGVVAPGWRDVPGADGQPTRGALAGALRSPVARGAAASVLAAGLVGTGVQTLAPLRLGEAGFSAEGLGLVFLAGACLALVATPLAGRLADRKGVRPVAASWAVLLAAAVLAPAVWDRRWVVVALIVMLVPLVRAGGALAFALGAEHAPLGAGLGAGYGLLLGAWSIGAVLGPLAAGTVADLTGDGVAFGVVAGLAALLVLPIAAARPSQRAELVVA